MKESRIVRTFVSGIMAATTLAVALLLLRPAQAETLSVQYSVKLIGLTLGTASLNSRIDPTSYQIEASAKLTGIATMVANSKGAATSSGLFLQGKVAPNAYATTSSNSRLTRTIRMGMNAGVVRGSEITPPFDEGLNRVPIQEIHKRGIIDPLSSLLMPVGGTGPVIGPAACDRNLPVYDGWTRFDVNLHYVGVRQVRGNGYAGPVAVCAARYVPIAGHRPDRPGTKFMADNRNMEVWLAPVGASRVVAPYRISVATMVGTTVIEALSFNATDSTQAQRGAAASLYGHRQVNGR